MQDNNDKTIIVDYSNRGLSAWRHSVRAKTCPCRLFVSAIVKTVVAIVAIWPLPALSIPADSGHPVNPVNPARSASPASSANPASSASTISPETTSAPSSDNLYYSEPEQVGTFAPMRVMRPALQALITVEHNLDPFQLDALGSRRVKLADVVDMAMENNLAIKVASLDVLNNLWKLRSAYTHFLPDARMGFMWDYLQGHVKFPVSFAATPGPLHISSPFIIAQAGVQYNVFQGGKVLFGALQSRNNLRTARWNYRAATNDVLLEASRRYYNLLLSEALLQIRIRAVETSKEQLSLNTDLEKDGKATHLDVLQAVTQLADDRQNLIEQQIARRNSAIQLAEYLNTDQSTDLVPIDTVVEPVYLIGPGIAPGRLLIAAADHRPELKSYQQQWLAAKKGIMIAAAPLFPTVKLNATEYGTGETLNNSSKTVITLTPIVVGSTVVTVPTTARVSKQITGLGVLGVTANWNLDAFGLTDLSNVQAARAQARQAMLRSNQEANTVISQVRQAYLNQLSALRRSEQSLARVNSAAEELRLARLRLQSGLGKNIDILRAQQDLTSALVQHAQSTIEFNIAQVQLLHDLGLMSRDNLLSSSPLKF